MTLFVLREYKQRAAMLFIPFLGIGVTLIGSDVKAELQLLNPPPPSQNQGYPALQYGRICPPLQKKLHSLLSKQKWAWSVSVLDQHGQLLADVNGKLPRIPASNQKLITTAFALDRLGPDFKLRTQLVRRSDGVLEISGEGDPDLGISEIQRFAMAALGQGGSRTHSSSEVVQLVIREEPRHRWWPNDWEPVDRTYAYGAPITRLALTSNALELSVINPANRLKHLFESEMLRQGGKAHLMLVDHDQVNNKTVNSVLLHKEDSAPMHALLSLANAESHNFTAEVLLRHAADSWDVKQASWEAMRWLKRQNLPTSGLQIADGSGLSRNNRLTSQALATLLMRMGNHPLAAYYQASMAIAGQRGTLRKLYRGSELEGKFWGKTGTLTGVRSVSGILNTKDGPRYVSALANGASYPNETIGQLLKATARFSPCPSSALTVKQLDEHG
ncbi:MAG: D-alanyl-D-alanine carboxypeptidase [Prochlorococcaceae cyanobacterium ETNP2_MAG_10]|nr:D-alanyl-D-alanine carboxypeptidase [Prochlorococcaceae cyanobacterium ETNP2_MAG_10]